MKSSFKSFSRLLVAAVLLFSVAACTQVSPGHVGVQVNKTGDSRGVDQELLQPGWHWTGPNVSVYEYPVFTQLEKWTKSSTEGRAADESISFQAAGGVLVNTDIGISYHVEEANVTKVFQKYRQPIEVVADNALRNLVRDELNRAGIKYDTEALQGKGKIDLMNEVVGDIQTKALALGITVEQVSFINDMRYPPNIVTAMNAKIQATQDAMRIENEVRKTKAESEKLIVAADAQVQVAKAEAEAMELRGKAMQANSSLLAFKQLEVQQSAIAKWDGKLPASMPPGSAVPFINLGKQ